MKICIIARSILKGGGQGRVNYEVVDKLLRDGHRITVVTSLLASELTEYSNLEWVNIAVEQVPTHFFANLYFAARVAAWLKRNRDRFDLIQTNGNATYVDTDVNVVHFVHSAWVKSPAHIINQRRDLYGVYQFLYSSFNAWWEKLSFARTKRVLAVSDKIKSELVQIGVPADKVDVVFNGVDLSEFHAGTAERSQLGLPEQGPLLLFVGDLRSNRKNLDSVLKAVAALPELQLVVLGNPERSPYPQMAVELGLESRVHFLGFRRDVAEIMRAVDVFVFPSRYEACTLALLEALASGLPVITSVSTGGSEIVPDNCGIVLEDCEDVVALQEAIATLLTDAGKCQQMGLSSRQLAENYAWSKVADRYFLIFEQVAKESNVPELQPC